MPDNIRAMTLAAALGVVAIGSLYVYERTPLLVVGFVFLALLVVTTWQPAVTLGLVAASLPLYHHPFRIGDSVLAPSELLLVAAVFGTAIGFALDTRLPESRDRGIRSFLLDRFGRLSQRFVLAAVVGLAMLAILGLAVLTGVDDAEARAAGLRELRWTLLEPLIFVVLLVWHLERPRQVGFVLGAFVAGGLAVSLWALIEVATGGGVSVGGVLRAEGPFPHPNAFALYLLRPVVFGGAILLVSRSRSRLAWILVGIGAVALTASFSRSAALGIVVAALLLIPWMNQRLRAIGLLGAATFVAGLIAFAGDRAIGSSGADSLSLRVDIWRSGLAMIRDRPISGYGPDQFLYVYSPRYIDPAAWAERFTSHGHNLIIDSWLRVGIIGAVLAGLAIAVIARSAGTVANEGESGRFDAIGIAAVVALAAAGTQGLVDNGYFAHDLAMGAWLIAWAAFGRSTRNRTRGALLHERDRDRRSRPRRLSPL